MKNFIKNIKIKLGYIECHVCNNFIKPKLIKDYIYHPEEPPMFYHYECPKCKTKTDIEPTLLIEKAIRDLGYKDFNDFMENKTSKLMKDILKRVGEL